MTTSTHPAPDLLDDGVLLELNGDPAFPDEVQNEAETVAERIRSASLPGKDLSHLCAIAVDDPDTVEVDDALAVETIPGGRKVHVLISNAAAWIPPDGPMDREACRRASTIYHPVDRCPMLPEVLSSDLLSLREGELRDVIDHQLSFDHEGRLFDVRVFRAVAKVHKRLGYEEAEALLVATDDPGDPVNSALVALRDLALLMAESRYARGALQFFPREPRLRVVDGRPVLKVIDTFSMSRRLVQEFMVCACTGVGALLHEHRIPCIFRIQSEPEIPISWNLADARRPAFILRSVRQLRRAEVSLQPGRHAALGVDQYTQITSPLRRYSDLMVQRQIFHWMRSGVGLYREGDLLARMADLEDRMLKIRRAMAEADRFWILAILRDLAGSQVQAEVSEVLSSSALVFLPEFGIQTRVFPKRTLQEGEMLRLQIIRADPVEDKLVLREPAKTCESGS